MQTDDIQADQLSYQVRREWLTGIAVFGLFVITLGAVVWGYQKSLISNKTMETQVQVPGASVKPEPSVKPETNIKPVYAVFNGSGKPGEAAKLKAKIEAAGYEVVEVGNALKPASMTTIAIEESLLSQKDEIVRMVGGGEYVPLTNEKQLKYNVEIIIGK